MNVGEFVANAFALAAGAIVIYAVIQNFCESYAGFCQYGWAIMAAYVAGAAFYLRYALRRDP